MQPSRETAHYGDLPSVPQLNKLNRQLMLFANRHDKLRVKSDGSGRTSYTMRPSVRFYRPDVLEAVPFEYILYESLGARAIYDTLEQTWSLRVYDSFEVVEYGSQRGGYRTHYSFEWNDDDVTKARHDTFVTPKRDKLDLVDTIDTLLVPDDVSWVPTLQSETESMTAGDVAYLTGQLATRMSYVDDGERRYREHRKNHLDYFAKGHDDAHRK